MKSVENIIHSKINRLEKKDGNIILNIRHSEILKQKAQPNVELTRKMNQPTKQANQEIETPVVVDPVLGLAPSPSFPWPGPRPPYPVEARGG
jgi:hypothetical protein